MTKKPEIQLLAVLITCHNRKEKTLICLNSLYSCFLPDNYSFDVFLVDDGSTDGTGEAVKKHYPLVNLIQGNGNLYWAGGMRIAWEIALKENRYNSFLLLNDDVILADSCLRNLYRTHNFSIQKTKKVGIYVGTTADCKNGQVSYGGHIITQNWLIMRSKLLNPSNQPQQCHFANGNILWICGDVVNKIGIFSIKFTHGIADFDYTLTAHKHKVPLWVAPDICGFCSNDHGNSWQSMKAPLKDRIAYLKSPKGLAFKEYLYFIKKKFPFFYPYSFVMLLLKTLFPFIWDRLK